MNTEDIPNIPDRERRFEEITVDCNDEYENLSAFEIYLTEALQFPFAAAWGQRTSATPVTVLGIADQNETEDVRLRVRHADGDEYVVPADQIWASEAPSVNATVLDDYRAFVEQGGLPFDESEEEWE
ncbi:MAG: hypothetical protein HGA19_02170 [Oscillochloris sp.]|nr:hypothetical protein [Oscillochloris sp.]